MDHLDGWRTEAARFCDLVDDADLGARVPACPDWDVADLAFHVGNVLDRFTQLAGGGITETDQVRELERIGRPEDDATLPGWLRERVAALDRVLAGLDPGEPVWNFTRRDMNGGWVLRRMHHEMVVHRHDLEEAVGTTTPIDDEVAADGVAEFMGSLAPAGQRWAGERSATLQVTEDATGRTWRLRLEPGERAEPDHVSEGAADMVVHGEGATLLLALWRRRPLDTVTMTGDADLAQAILATIGR